MSETTRIRKNIETYRKGTIVAIRIYEDSGVIYIDFKEKDVPNSTIKTQRFWFGDNAIANEINRNQLCAIFGNMANLCLKADDYIGTEIRFAVQAVVKTSDRTFEDFALLPGSNSISEERFATLLSKIGVA